MNKKRRTKISNVIKRLNDCKDDLESIKEDEDEARENIPEPFPRLRHILRVRRMQ